MKMNAIAPMISFILPSYNREPILKTVLGNLRGDFGLPYEIIVVDNGSTDGSTGMVERDFPQVRLLARKSNYGAVSRNFALKQARGEYVVMLDDDSFPEPDAVRKSVRILEHDYRGEIGCIALNIRRPDGRFETAGIYTSFTGCGAVFRKSVLERVGGYPDDYCFYVEEYDLSFRLWQRGYSVLNFKELQAVHLKADLNRDFNRILRQLVRNNMQVWAKYLPRDLADRQIGQELWRYQKIGLKESAMEGFLEGRRLGAELVERYRSLRDFEVDRVTAERMLDLPNIRRRAGQLADRLQGKRVIVAVLGKLVSFLLEELRTSGLEVIAIVDGNVHMQNDTFEGVPIFGWSRLGTRDYDGVIIGSSALAINDAVSSDLAASDLGVPVSRLCDYDCLESYLPGE